MAGEWGGGILALRVGLSSSLLPTRIRIRPLLCCVFAFCLVFMTLPGCWVAIVFVVVAVAISHFMFMFRVNVAFHFHVHFSMPAALDYRCPSRQRRLCIQLQLRRHGTHITQLSCWSLGYPCSESPTTPLHCLQPFGLSLQFSVRPFVCCLSVWLAASCLALVWLRSNSGLTLFLFRWLLLSCGGLFAFVWSIPCSHQFLHCAKCWNSFNDMPFDCQCIQVLYNFIVFSAT